MAAAAASDGSGTGVWRSGRRGRRRGRMRAGGRAGAAGGSTSPALLIAYYSVKPASGSTSHTDHLVTLLSLRMEPFCVVQHTTPSGRDAAVLIVEHCGLEVELEGLIVVVRVPSSYVRPRSFQPPLQTDFSVSLRGRRCDRTDRANAVNAVP